VPNGPLRRSPAARYVAANDEVCAPQETLPARSGNGEIGWKPDVSLKAYSEAIARLIRLQVDFANFLYTKIVISYRDRAAAPRAQPF
jgi:hypothetical protein